MRAKEFWKTIVADRADFLTRLLALLSEHGIRFCVLGGQGVNAYAEPVVSLDLDLVVAVDQLPEAERLLSGQFHVERFPHSLNVSELGSDLRVQIQTDPRYVEFVQRAVPAVVLGVTMPVASLDDVLQGKLWAVVDSERRPSKRQKDLADIARLLEAYPELRKRVPAEVLKKLV